MIPITTLVVCALIFPLATEKQIAPDGTRLAIEKIEKGGGRVSGSAGFYAVRFFPDAKLHRDVISAIKDLDGQLDLSFESTDFDDALLEEIPEDKIIYLNLTYTRITSNAASLINKMKKLKALKLNGTRMDDSGMNKIGTLDSLIALELESTKVTEKGLTIIERNPSLFHIKLADVKVTGAVLKAIAALPRGLKTLSLRNTQITDEMFSILAKRKEIRSACLSNNNITDTSLRILGSFGELGYLDLTNTKITDKGLVFLKEMKIDHIKLAHTKIQGEGLRHLHAVSGSVDLTGVNFSRSGVSGIQFLGGIYSLDLTDTNFDDGNIRLLSKLIHLEDLSLDGTRITGLGLSALRSVEILSLRRTKLSPSSVGELEKIKSLKHLYLDRDQIPTEGRQRIKSAIPGISIPE